MCSCSNCRSRGCLALLMLPCRAMKPHCVTQSVQQQGLQAPPEGLTTLAQQAQVLGTLRPGTLRQALYLRFPAEQIVGPQHYHINSIRGISPPAYFVPLRAGTRYISNRREVPFPSSILA